MPILIALEGNQLRRILSPFYHQFLLAVEFIELLIFSLAIH